MTRLQPTPDLEAKIREGHALGKSLSSIARDIGVDKGDLSRWAKRAGLTWTGTPYASNVVRERLAYNRLLLAEAALADALAIRERLWDQHEVIVNTPEGPKLLTLDLPDARATADYAAAIERLIKSHSVMSESSKGSLVNDATSTLGRMRSALERYVADLDAKEDPEPDLSSNTATTRRTT